jgi:hypothetical protein
MECVDDCPKNSLDIYIFGRKMQKRTFTWLVVALFFVALGLITMTPVWQTKPISNIVSEQ